MEMTFLILYCRLNGKGNQKGLIWVNLLPLNKVTSYVSGAKATRRA